MTWSRKRAERDAAIREDILKKIQERLDDGTTEPKDFVTHKGYKQFLGGLDEGKPEINLKAIELSKKRDGFFGVLTNVPSESLSGEEIYARYKELWRIEDAFGEIKGPLETRPMFHWVDQRIQSHVLLCLLAYYVEAIITRDLHKAAADFTVGQWLRALNHVHAIPIDVKGTRAWVRNEITGLAAQGYELLHLKIPGRVMKIEKIRSDEV